MKKYIYTATLTILFSALGFSQNCSKNLSKNEKYNSGPVVESKGVTFHQPSVSNGKKISFQVKDSSRMFVHIDINYGTWQVGTKVELIFNSGEKVTTYITLRETERTGSTQTKRYDCQIRDRKDVDMLYQNKIAKITVHSIGQTFDLSAKKADKIKDLFTCTADAVGISNVNYRSAKKSAPDPYTENTIVVSIGGTNNDMFDVECEYEKNEIDEFTGEKSVVTKVMKIGTNLNMNASKLNGAILLKFQYIGLLGCSNIDSHIILKFMDGTTLKMANAAKEDCGENPFITADVTKLVSKLKVKNIEKIRVVYSDGQADIEVSQPDIIRGILNKCL
jgi:hypothetical protein